MEEVIEEGPWLFQGQPVVLQPWEQGMSLRRQKHLQVPVWVRLRHLPMEYWTEEGLSAVASGIGIPLYTDKITKHCLRLDFARVCVMLDYHSKLPRHLVVISPVLSAGKEVPIKIDIEYEWLPLRCKQCCSLGHTANSCPETKGVKQKAPVAVYVQKQPSAVKGGPRGTVDEMAATSSQMGQHVDKSPTHLTTVDKEHVATAPATIGRDISVEPSPTKARDHSDKGKQLVLYNPFTVLRSAGMEGEENMQQVYPHDSGPNQSSPVDNPP
ncbi:UNVERIFIED_CONTAM: hypothetical protein Sradi_7226400 [Sesamum radiatum]|uniref:DUF4283 domain-containing protein n=1 Tax=Sesamum radiatum TaxID=300843 RepID=A0AAW2INC3_SESRA